MTERKAKKVLVIDAHPDIRQLLEIMVQKIGAVSETVSSVSEAKIALQARSFDLIVCDVTSNESECEDFVLGVHRQFPRFPFVLFAENRGTLPSKLRNDHCFALPRYDFKLLQQVVGQLLEDSEVV